jgi:phosphoglycerol transferase MdoB-like AlkP superfamily enzyme
MQTQANSALTLLKKLGLLLGLYIFCRLLFYWFNHSYFSDIGFGQLLLIMLAGLRFDFSVIILSNSLFILLYLLPFPFRELKAYRAGLRWLFVITNSIATLANCADLIYFQFTLKRTTADVFNFFGGGIGNDLGRLLPLFLKEYWYIFLIWIFLSFLIWYFYKKLEKPCRLTWNLKQYLKQTLILVISIVLGIIIYRGGFQLKPVSTVDAGEYTSAKNVPLVVNTPFTILKTLDLESIEPTIYYTDEKELQGIYTTASPPPAGEFKKLNVVIIALESFSKEYMGSINGHGWGRTPFLDSLSRHSLTFVNAFSNGKTSIQGIPAIVAGIPTWMNEPYISSPYGSNQINALASLLKQKGYYTAFFHGGTNGTMGFEAFSGIAGYDSYFGRTEYNNEKDYDGNWGIWDEEFFQYTANTINQQKEPFFATLFTLTSHHPYPIPDKYKEKFPEGRLPLEKCISYSDYSLQHFFETAKKMPWFKNTLFVLSADHTGISENTFFQNKVGNNTIPILYYLPGSDLKGIDSTVTQQIDIQASVLDYLNYPGQQFSFGKSVFDTTAQHIAFTYNSGIYQLIEGGYSLEFNGEKGTELYYYKTDSLLKDNLVEKLPGITKSMERKAKAIIQTYQQSLINNKMH